MSGDDIQFGEIKFREPQKARRPDRDPKLACLAVGLPGANDLPIFLDKKAADKIERHALRDTSVELGGIVLGKECIDEINGAPFVWITEALEAKHYESSEARFKYTHESWGEITREREALHPNLDIVGWYHTHPDFGIFLSGLDLFIHENYFNQPLQIAYVVDPIRQTRGFFQWRNGRMESEPIPGFYLVADRGDRIALARYVNDLEGVANSEGGGGGLSPRLEAQLIAMLSRPQYSPAPSGYDLSRHSSAQTILGVMLGALALGLVLWINGLYSQLRDQGERLEELKTAVKETTDMQRLALDSLLSKAEKTGEGTPSSVFLDSYKKAVAERDRLRVEAENRDALINRVAAESKTARLENSDLRAKLAAAEKRLDESQLEVKEAKTTLVALQKLQEQSGGSATKGSEASELAKELGSDGGASLLRRYNSVWYTAVAGWAGAVIALMGLAYLWMQGTPAQNGLGESMPQRPITVSLPPTSPPNSPGSDQPHRIS